MKNNNPSSCRPAIRLFRKQSLILMLCLLMTISHLAAPVPVSAAARNGWQTINGKKYYYIKGRKQKGWKTIRGKEYYFSDKGVLQVNQIAGSSSNRYAYVDKHGIRCRNEAIQAACSLVLRLTRPTWSQRQKLETCYWYLVNNCRYAADFYDFRPDNFASIAGRMFANEVGDCYESALAMLFLARVLGYDGKLATGKVSSRSSVIHSKMTSQSARSA